jgi:hypothetical protein
MAYRTTPNTLTGYSPFYLLHGREIVLPGNENLKAKISTENLDHKRRLESLKSSLKLAYKAVARANRKSHDNKKRYHRKAKARRFEAGELVFLHNPSIKLGLTKKFLNPWKGLYKVTNRLSDLNYEFIGQNNKKQVVHINRLKKAYNQNLWKPQWTTPLKKNKKCQLGFFHWQAQAVTYSRIKFKFIPALPNYPQIHHLPITAILHITPQRHLHRNENFRFRRTILRPLGLGPGYCHKTIQISNLMVNIRC